MLLELDPQLVALAVFLAVFAAIASGKVDRAIAALLGSLALWALGVIGAEDIFHFIDFEVLALLFGMMIIVACLRQARFFRWLGLHMANLSGYDPIKILVIFTLMTAFLSAFLDNVTTMLFMIAITLEITDVLKLPATPFVLGQIFAANIGGTATLIGDPPNIMIAGAFDFAFMDFIDHIAPIITAIMLFITFFWYMMVRRRMKMAREIVAITIRPGEVIEDRKLFYSSITIFIITIGLFVIHDRVGLEVATIALMGGIVLLGLVGNKVPGVFKDVEWETLIFFASIFVVVGGLEKTGLIREMARTIAGLTGDNPVLALSSILWVAAFGSATIGNIPLTATFIPLLRSMSDLMGIDLAVMAWALSLGTGLGGNGTPIASSATIIAIGIMKDKGHPISFKEYVKYGLLIMSLTLLIANLYLILRYIYLA